MLPRHNHSTLVCLRWQRKAERAGVGLCYQGKAQCLFPLIPPVELLKLTIGTKLHEGVVIKKLKSLNVRLWKAQGIKRKKIINNCEVSFRWLHVLAFLPQNLTLSDNFLLRSSALRCPFNCRVQGLIKKV